MEILGGCRRESDVHINVWDLLIMIVTVVRELCKRISKVIKIVTLGLPATFVLIGRKNARDQLRRVREGAA